MLARSPCARCWDALARGNGSMAQFNHPELGGNGQWMPGMIMIGEMFNHALKAKVNALCTELAPLTRNATADASATAASWQQPGQYAGDAASASAPALVFNENVTYAMVFLMHLSYRFWHQEKNTTTREETMTLQNGAAQHATQSAPPSPHAGQWYVAACSEAVQPGETLVKIVADQEIVFWRSPNDDRTVQAASAVCPHWGGPLGEGRVSDTGCLTCPWHGWQFRDGYCLERPRLKLPRYLAHDDGIFLWVRLPWDVDDITEPPLQQRPADCKSFWFHIAIASDVYHVQENYLDFLHPAEYHTSVFNHCEYLGKEGDVNLVELGYKMPFGKTLMTRTRVWAPTPYQVRNEVYDGLGKGIVIESHITPIHTDRSIIHEAYHVPASLTPRHGWSLMRFLMMRSARRIREEDAIFAARRYRLRTLGFVDGRGLPVNGQVAPYLATWKESEAAGTAAHKLRELVGKTARSHS